MQDEKRPILVTGAHRSGTTWVGKMIAASPSIGYVHEPFNPVIPRPGICGAKFRGFTYVCEKNETDYYEHIRRTCTFTYNVMGALGTVRSWRHLTRILKEYAIFADYRRQGARPLLKDPIAVFSAEWLASRFAMSVVVLIRHPAAFVSSIKQLNWEHSFSEFLEQRLLMDDHLKPFEAEIREYAAARHDIIEQAALIWKLIYHVVRKYRDRHPEWSFVRHEDLSLDPAGQFQELFGRLHLEYSEEIARTIQQHSDRGNPAEAAAGTLHMLKRDSKSSIHNWKNRLTAAEIGRIRELVEDVSSVYYSNDDW